ncbi:lanthionine synthetase LanC family protein [Kitasatospora sp. NPDC056651]|uniref:lanthionine synthetase LanC family protein n=1 Tax=Kitasatospora sp. NPDC056651 TaxID=3345892 RepID=UPI0036CD0D3E
MTVVTGILTLPDDVELTPVARIGADRLVGIPHEATDWILTRPRSRTRSCVVADDLALVLARFRGGARVVDVIIRLARDTAQDPQQLLEEVWPALSRFVDTDWLVPEGSPGRTRSEPWYPPGSLAFGQTVVRCLSVLPDSQVYRARTARGTDIAMKLVDESATPGAGHRLAAEADILARLGGVPAPTLVDLVTEGTRSALVMEWCPGVPITRTAEEQRNRRSGRPKLRALLGTLLGTYAAMHGRGVLHGDVHPRNVIVDGDAAIRLVDFGLARVIGAPAAAAGVRGGVPEYMDPELASALRDGVRPASVTSESEQYALAALCYRLATGHPYVDLPAERREFLRTVVEREPVPFRERGVPDWPDVEHVITTALSKDPGSRFRSVGDMAGAMAAGAEAEPPARPVTGPGRLASLVPRVEARFRPDGELFATGPVSGPRATVMTGAAGIAYYLLCASIADGSPTLLEAADQWVEQAGRWAEEPRGVLDEARGMGPELVGAVSPYHTGSGIEVVRALVAEARGDVDGVVTAVRRYIRLAGLPCAGLDPTLGRTSVIVPAALLVGALRDAADRSTEAVEPLRALLAFGQSVLDSVWRDLRSAAASAPPGARRALLAGTAYTGAAHGWAGILYATLIWSEASGIPVPPGVRQRLGELAALAVPDGHGVTWPTRLDGSGHEVMRGWCHGAPGHVHLWTAAHRLLGDPSYLELASRAAWSTFEHDGGGVSLCCGEAGRVFALLAMYRHSGDAEWLARADRCLGRAATRLTPLDDGGLANSLYKGEPGLALALRETARPDDARQPLFEP